jgi:hypothetical protein
MFLVCSHSVPRMADTSSVLFAKVFPLFPVFPVLFAFEPYGTVGLFITRVLHAKLLSEHWEQGTIQEHRARSAGSAV